MKNLTNYFNNKNILFKDIEQINPSSINSRKKLDIYCTTSIIKEYYAIFIINQKSRFLRKNAQELIELCQKLAEFKEHNFKKKVLLISSPICSKAKEFLKDNGWSVKNDFM